METCEKLLIVEDLKTHFITRQGLVKAVDGVSFSIDKGEIVGLVGESGCGKSMTSLSIMGLVPQPAGKIVGGKIYFENKNLLEKSAEEMRQVRGNRIAMIVQDAMVSLNPLLKIGYQISEPIRFHNKITGSIRQMCVNLLQKVKIPSPEMRIREYPFQFSGGMCQRALIAAGISCDPQLLIADEPTTALDVTIQAQILKLLKEIRAEYNSAILMITHDLAVVAQICERVMVMYAGKIVEQADVTTFFKTPAHPYSLGLKQSVPVLRSRVEELYTIEGQPPSLVDPPEGCRFAPRCLQSREICFRQYPPEFAIGNGHIVSCWLYQKG